MYSEADYIDFFEQLIRLLTSSDILKYKNFENSPIQGKNFLKFTYPELSPGYFEIQFASISKTHKKLFGELPLIIFAYYYPVKTKNGDHLNWLSSMKSKELQLSNDLGCRIIINEWNTNWMILGKSNPYLPPETNNTNEISNTFIEFINVTYPYLLETNINNQTNS